MNYRVTNRILLYVVLIIMTFFIGFPLIATFSQSFLHSNDILQYPPQLINGNETLDNYMHLFQSQDTAIPRWTFNSFLVSTAVTLLTVIICAPAAYAFARLRFPGRNILFFVFLATIMIPSQVTLIPNFLLMRDFH